jgi:hypothetical protein
MVEFNFAYFGKDGKDDGRDDQLTFKGTFSPGIPIQANVNMFGNVTGPCRMPKGFGVNMQVSVLAVQYADGSTWKAPKP